MQRFASRFVGSHWRVWLLMLLSLVPAVQLAAAEATKIDGFTLPDTYGRERSLAEFNTSPMRVVAFLGAECPLARLYGPRLQELCDEYSAKGVAFIGIDANSQDTLTDLTNYGRLYGVKFPLLKDRDGAVADKFGAVRNPEVFLLDKDNVIRYRGRVDDQYGIGASAGYAKTELTDRSLGRAIDELLASKPVTVATTQATGCLIGRLAKIEPKGEITYTKHVAKILQDRCLECHRDGQVAPFALGDYEQAVGWASMMKEVISEGRMPPWSANPEYGQFHNDPRLTPEELKTFHAWIDNGCPEGNPNDLPPPRQWAEGWRIPKPDQIISMTEPFHIPAEGVINYKSFTVDPGWTEDKWISMAEVQPGAFGNVHHIIVSISAPRSAASRVAFNIAEGDVIDGGAEPDAPPTQQQSTERTARPRGRGGRGGGDAAEGGEGGQTARRGGGTSEGLDAQALRGGRLSAFIPGRNPTICPPDTAVFAPAGSKLTFQMHYTTNGKECDDISRVGVVFANPKTVKYLSYTSGASNGSFRIPPYAENYKVESDVTFRTDTALIVLHPHMHLRGKSMRYEAIYPDGTTEILLDVPKYDPSWQFEYELAQPKPMPAGTRMHVTAHFDNSEANPANPDPSKTITFGPQTWDEMMIGFYSTITPVERAFATRNSGDKAAASTPE